MYRLALIRRAMLALYPYSQMHLVAMLPHAMRHRSCT